MSSEKPLQSGAEYKRQMPDPAAAGRASGAARRKKANLRRAALDILACKPRGLGDPARKAIRAAGLDPDDVNNADVMLLIQLDKAVNKGDTSAAIFLRDTSGQAPTAKQEISVDRPAAGCDLRLLSNDELQKLIDNE